MHVDIEYDERAVGWIASLEHRLGRRLPDDRFGGFAAILNAIEYQVEQGQADLTVLRHLGEALLALASVHRLPPPLLKDITQTLGLLHGHVATLHQAP